MGAAEPKQSLIRLQWLSYVGATTAILFICLQTGLIGWVIERDQSYISLLIFLIFGFGLLRGGWVCFRLEAEAYKKDHAIDRFIQSRRNDQALQVMIERLRGPQELGWFVTGLATKLGLLGTVIGFILMMGAVTQVESFDFSAAQELIQRMTYGIGIALTTTLLGLIASILLGFQSYFIERYGETLIADTVERYQDKA